MKKKLMLLSVLVFVLAFAFACANQQPAPAPSAPPAGNPPANPPATPPATPAPSAPADDNRSMDEVKRIAINAVGSGNGVITKYEVKAPENADWTYVEFEIQVDNQEHDVDVDRRAGTIREKNVENNRRLINDYANLIGLEEAERIALERVGEAGSVIIEFELEDVDDNSPVSYDFEILGTSGRFEVEVDAMNGEVRKFEKY